MIMMMTMMILMTVLMLVMMMVTMKWWEQGYHGEESLKSYLPWLRDQLKQQVGSLTLQ